MQIRFVEAPNNFYIGASADPQTGDIFEDLPIYYDARHLTTHGVILGMTGSGKTGLGITLIEEAVIDKIPTIIIDPKGDITNILLAFPDLTAENFRPWVHPETPQSIDEDARRAATVWREGLSEWGITNDRIQEFRRAAKFSIYTPGSEAGLQVSILQSFAVPREGWAGNEEQLRERITGMVTALLALIGIDAQPVEDREHILLSNIFEYNWRNGVDLSMEQLILQVQRPPFTKLGVFDVETLFPEKDRFKLAQKLNNIIAAPNFQNWIKGEPLDVGALLSTAEGYPRTTIFYLAHLNDVERQFIITLLLQSVLAWMRAQTGSTSLRALIYIDEVFGMFPPYPRNPPTKEPIMRLLKQARAYGIGMLVATQNPADLDYKGLSNAGTWFIGKMQTDNDKNRVLEGLDSARDASSGLDIRVVGDQLNRLRPRQFILHDVHEQNTPILMTTRWTMSYLRGPLTREEVARLMQNQRAAAQAAAPPPAHPSYFAAAPAPDSGPFSAASPTYSGRDPSGPAFPGGGGGGEAPPVYGAPAGSLPPSERPAPPGFSAVQPVIPSAVQQYFLPTEYAVEQAIKHWEQRMGQPAIDVQTNKRLLYRPSLLAQLQVRFNHTPTSSSEILWYAFVVPNLPTMTYLDWSEYQSEPFDPRSLDREPFVRPYYGEVPQSLSKGAGFKELQASLVDWVYNNARMVVLQNPTLKMTSALGESRRDFVARVRQAAREARDAELDALTDKYQRKLQALEDRYQTKAMRLDSHRAEVEGRRQEELVTGAEAVMRLMKGSVYNTISKSSRLRRMTSQSEDRQQLMEQELADITEQMETYENELRDRLAELAEKWKDIANQIVEVPIAPLKKDISFVLFGIGWVPYWDVVVNGSPLILPASSSGLTQAQDPGSGGGGYY